MQLICKLWCCSVVQQKVLLLITIGLLAANASYITASPESATIGVIFPTVREPYRSIFNSVIDGVDLQTGHSVLRFSLDKVDDMQLLNEWVIENNLDSIITLGRLSHHLTQSLSLKIPITTGAVLMSPDLNNKVDSGIVLNPDPDVVFKQLRNIAPKIKRIIVIYNPDNNSWLIKKAKQSAKNLNIKLVAYHVTELYQAALLYRDIFKQESGAESALWLLNDNSIFDNNAILPLILKQSWDRKFLVFSNNPAHVKRGVLFAMFPNNIQMGKSLAKMALHRINSNGSEVKLMQPLSDLLVAFNNRTAEHLRISVSRRQRTKFDLEFPAQ